MITLLPNTILSLCFSYLDLNSLLESKQVNTLCNRNIDTQYVSWEGTKINLQEIDIKHILKNLYIHDITIDSYPKKQIDLQ